MKIVVNDANILMDLIKTELIDEFFDLEYEMHTTEFIINECDSEQKDILNGFINHKKLKSNSIEYEELIEIQNIFQENQSLSFPDCSVYHFANTKQAILLTGDKKLRSFAERQKLEVHGIFWIIDEMYHNKLISKIEYQKKLKILKAVNKRLPNGEFDKRLK